MNRHFSTVVDRFRVATPRFGDHAFLARVVLVALSLAALVSVTDPTFAEEGWKDEYLVPWYGKHVAGGDVPYRDFFLFIGPLGAYASAALFSIKGATIVTYKLAFIFGGVLATLALFDIARSRGATPTIAAAAAVVFPLLYVPSWPSSTHQWFAVELAVISCWLASRPGSPRLAVVSSGLFAAASLLVVQTIGILAVAAAAVLALNRQADRFRSARWFATGVAMPVLACFAVLALAGALDDWFQLAVLWPLQFYKQPGGYNDVVAPLWLAPPTRFQSSGTFASVSLALIPLTAVVAFVGQALAGWSARKDRVTAAPLAVGLALVILGWLIFQAGRSDAPHLAYVSPLFLVILAARSAGVAGAWLRPYMVLLPVIPLVAWAHVWVKSPPDPVALFDADAYIEDALRESGLYSLVGGDGSPAPVVFVSSFASVFYFYRSESRPPVDWLTPPSSGSYSPREYAALAAFIRNRRIPFVVIENANGAMLHEPSPLRDVLLADYRFVRRIPAGLVLVQRDTGA